MKKVISILMVLCIAASVFAVGTIKVGGAFDFVTGKTGKFDDALLSNKLQYKAKGFGFDVSGSYDLADSLSVWADFNMVFPSTVEIRHDGANDWGSLDVVAEQMEAEVGQKASKSVYKIAAAAGVAFKLPVAEIVNVSVGGGVFFESLIGKVSASVPENTNATVHHASFTQKFMNLGLTTYADVTCKVASNIGISLTAMPRIGLLSIANVTQVEDNDPIPASKATAFSVSFSMPVAVGVSYSF